MLHWSRVSKSFGSTPAIQSVDLRVEQATTVALIGPSGCGKSTLLRLMIGLLELDNGEVRFDGQCLDTSNIRQLRRRMGYVIQSGGLFPHLSVRGNVTLLARHMGWSDTRIEQRLDELLVLTHLPEELLGRFPSQLSGGQRQRVSLMRALMLDPDALLLDEPLGALDPMIRADLQDDLKQIFETLHKTVVLVTHDLAEADFFASNLVLLRAGQIVQRGSLDDLRQRPVDEFVRRFVRAQRLGLESKP